MFGSSVDTKTSLLDLAKVYSPKYQGDESYLRPKTDSEIVDQICQRIAFEPKMLTGHRNLSAFKNYLKDCLKKDFYPIGVVRLVSSFIKHSAALNDIDKGATVSSSKNDLLKIGSLFYQSAHKELKRLRKDFDTCIRPTDGMRLQISPAAQHCYVDIKNLQSEMQGLDDPKFTSNLYLLGLGQYEIRSFQRLIDDTVTYFDAKLRQREKQIVRAYRSSKEIEDMSMLRQIAGMIFPKSWQ